MRYREHLTAMLSTTMRYLLNASFKQSAAQGSAQSGADNQERTNQQQGPATQQGRSTRCVIRHLITYPLWHHNTRSHRDGVMPSGQHRWSQDASSCEEHLYKTPQLYLMAERKNRKNREGNKEGFQKKAA
jgi:hypothetical protein